MGRFHRLPQLLAGVLLLAPVRAQEPPPPPSAELSEPQPPPSPNDRRERPPNERNRFPRNLKNWDELSDEEKNKLRERGKQLFERGRQEVEKAISELDVELSPEKRREFIKAYMDKRRQIERQIWEETKPRRQELIQEAVADLKKEFGGRGDKPTAPSPAPSATP